MYKRKLISLIVISISTSVVIMTGCGGGSSSSVGLSSSSGDTKSSSSSSQILIPTQVRVSDAYVLNADVSVGDVVFTHYVESGIYEINQENLTGLLKASNGINDLNNNGQIDNGEPHAPLLTAPSGYKNITPFTTLLVNGVDIISISDYNAVASFAPLYDFDVVAEGGNFENGIAQATAIAALRLSAGGDGSYTEITTATNSSTSNNSSSSLNSSVANGGMSVLPQANAYRGILPGGDSSQSVNNVLNSSSSANQSSLGYISSSSSTISSVSADVSKLSEAIEKIKAAQNMDELNVILKEYFTYFNDTSLGIASSSSVNNGFESTSQDDCLPGDVCGNDESSSSMLSSSSIGVSDTSNNQQSCADKGGTWNSEINRCLLPVTSSSSTSVPVQSTMGGVLPE